MPAATAEVIRVSPGADAENALVGDTWENATNLQRALAIAGAGDEIWAASGIYYPDEGEGQTDNSFTASFHIRRSLALYGGFAGTETERSQRDLDTTPPSILSGDIEQDDASPEDGIARSLAEVAGTNTETLVYCEGEAEWLLDGFSITAGIDGGGIGGIDNRLATLTVANCRFSGNRGALRVTEASAAVFDCEFSGNSRSSRGAAIYSIDSELSVEGGHFEANEAGEGAVHVLRGRADIAGSEFRRNQSDGNGGGALDIAADGCSVADCRFFDNGSRGGGAIRCTGDDLVIAGGEFSESYLGFTYTADARLLDRVAFRVEGSDDLGREDSWRAVQMEMLGSQTVDGELRVELRSPLPISADDPGSYLRLRSEILP